MQKLINEYINCFCNVGQDHSLTLNQYLHSLTVSNSQVYSNDEFDLWPVYSGERLRVFRPSCCVNGMANHGYRLRLFPKK